MRTEANPSNFEPSRCRPHAQYGAGRGIRPFGAALLEEANEREMTERRHGAAFDQANAPGLFRPSCIAFEGELSAPAELARRRREPVLESAPHTGFRADAAD